MSKIELLAPAGDLERAKIAIRYGADAVYIGGKRFSLRARASNFDVADIAEAVIFAQEYNAKIYVTVNIIPHQEDLIGIEDYLKQLEAIGVSAIICSSLEIVGIAKKVTTKMEVHLSTQQSVTNSKAMKFYQGQGVDRIVLARELSIEEIALTQANSDLPIEIFIHGGMCANYSGRCTMSNFMTLRDANRGGCAHSCRWFYHLYDNDNELTASDRLFTLASCDLLALEYILKLIDLNVTSLKIEGRMKSAYYIASVVKTYRNLIDEYYQNKQMPRSRIDHYLKEFAKAENRLAADGYLSGRYKEDPISALRKTSASQEYIGMIIDQNDDMILVEVRNRFVLGDVVEVLSQTQTNRCFKVTKILDEDLNPLEICNRPMQKVWLSVPFEVNVNDMLRRGDEDAL
ncbi:MAG: U32 family peptidase [Erysipelotrichaceae bacterium]|nr:U32 family peptidase [Erysipelotrichaceae bacterium]